LPSRLVSICRTKIVVVVALSLLAILLLDRESRAGTANVTEMFVIAHPTTLHGVFFHDGVMYATGIANLLLRIDPATGQVLEVISPLIFTPHGGHLHGATLGPDGTFWVVEAHSNTIYQLRLDDYSVVSTVAAPPGEPYSLAYRDGVLWVGPHGYSTPTGLPLETIYAIDPASGEILDQFRYAQIDAHGMVWLGDYLWVLDNISDSIHQLDVTGQLVDTFRLPPNNWFGMAHDGSRFCADNPGTFFQIELAPSVCPAPGEVIETRFLDKTTLSWNEPTQLGGTAVVYDTIRSPNPGDFNTLARCVESDDGDDLPAEDDVIPTQGEFFRYLVRAENACAPGVGPLGSGSSGAEHVGRTCP
jgi:hypothetical protein